MILLVFWVPFLGLVFRGKPTGNTNCPESRTKFLFLFLGVPFWGLLRGETKGKTHLPRVKETNFSAEAEVDESFQAFGELRAESTFEKEAGAVPCSAGSCPFLGSLDIKVNCAVLLLGH